MLSKKDAVDLSVALNGGYDRGIALEIIANNTPRISKVVFEWEIDCEFDMLLSFDEAIHVRKNAVNRNFTSEIDFPATIKWLLKEAGAAVEGESSAYVQAARIARDFKRWQNGYYPAFSLRARAYDQQNNIIAETYRLCGICEPDSEYMKDLEAQMLEELGLILEDMGFSPEEISEMPPAFQAPNSQSPSGYVMSDPSPVPHNFEGFTWDAHDSDPQNEFWICDKCGEENTKPECGCEE